MLEAHKNQILCNLAYLVEETDLNSLALELLNRNVFNERMINRILNPALCYKQQKINLYLEVLRRGPQAYHQLQNALRSTNHFNLAEILNEMDQNRPSLSHYISGVTSTVDSRRSPSPEFSDSENDGPCLSSKSIEPKNGTEVLKIQENLPSTPPINSLLLRNGSLSQGSSAERLKTKDLHDSHQEAAHLPGNKVFNLPNYSKDLFDENIRSTGYLCPNDVINYVIERNRPVIVKYASCWQPQMEGKPRIYKMDSNPRGYALLINNMNFDNEEVFPYRQGSDNDLIRMNSLLKQLHYVVEIHENKTKNEMEEIVIEFSQKQELNDVDSIIVVIMSHGEEGNSRDDYEIIGVDGIGYNVDDIVRQFHNDVCKAMIDKAKMFFFQACRGILPDTGVLVGHGLLNYRIEYDGGERRIPQMRPIRIRSVSDIFIAYACLPGKLTNRDIFTGSWFIQTIVDVFSEHACNTHLEDLFKKVDEKIKNMNNLYTSNFQTVSTKTMGWNKHLYFNPGLYRDKVTRETKLFKNIESETHEDEGMDVVDTIDASKTSYSRLKEDKDKEEENSDEKSSGCFNLPGCSTS